MRLFIPFLILIVFSFAACQPPLEKQKSSPLVKNTFFDLKGYFQKEIKRLEGTKGVVKTVSINEEQETKTVNDILFSEELMIFSNADINRGTWIGKYSIDSLFTEQKKLSLITYKALEDKLKTQFIQISYTNEEISKIEIQTVGESPIALSKKQLIYEPNTGYSILSEQDVTLASQNKLLVTVFF